MRILHVSQRYYPVVGGAESHLAKISEYLVSAGHEVHVATSDAYDFELFWDSSARRIEKRQENHNGVRVERHKVHHLPFSPTSYWAMRRLMLEMSRSRAVPVSWFQPFVNLTPRLPSLTQWSSKDSGPIDLVMGMNIAYERFLADGLAMARRLGVPFVSIPLSHLGAGSQPGADRLGQYYTMRHQLALVQASDAVIAQTPSEKQFFESRGFDPAKIIVGGPGVTPEDVSGGQADRFRSRHDLNGPFILSVGVMSLDKGTIHLVQAMQRLWQLGRLEKLVLIGHPLPEFTAFMKALPAEMLQNILLLGAVDDEEKKDALAAAGLFALPSRADSFGIVYLEAWLYGLPVIGAQTWGVSDLIAHGDDGLLVPFGDLRALAEAIAYLLDHQLEAIAMGMRGKEKVLHNHTWDKKCQIVLDLYEYLVGG